MEDASKDSLVNRIDTAEDDAPENDIASDAARDAAGNSIAKDNTVKDDAVKMAEHIAERAALRNELRAEAKRARTEMPAPYRAHKSAELCKQLIESLQLTLGITGINPQDAIIGVYSAFREEVDLQDFIEHAYSMGCTVAFPCMVRDAWGVDGANSSAMPQKQIPQQTMEMRAVSADDYKEKRVAFLNNPLKRYSHNDADLEPYPYCSADQLTMIVVPVVGFDSHGNRLGYGAGNYDRYLAQIPSTCRIAGVAFAEQQVDDIPTEGHDIPLAIVSL